MGYFDFFPQSAQTSHVPDDKEKSISKEVVIISDDDSEDSKSPKDEGDGKQKRRSTPRLRWTLLEDCQLVEAVASCTEKLVWRTIAAEFPNRSGNSCRLRRLKLLKPDQDASIDNRWLEIATLVGDHAISEWRVKIAQNLPDYYALISANHPLNKSCVENAGPMITDPSVGGDNGVGDTSMVGPALDLSLSLAITGYNQN